MQRAGDRQPLQILTQQLSLQKYHITLVTSRKFVLFFLNAKSFKKYILKKNSSIMK
jgi:hypothetical protein